MQLPKEMPYGLADGTKTPIALELKVDSAKKGYTHRIDDDHVWIAAEQKVVEAPPLSREEMQNTQWTDPKTGFVFFGEHHEYGPIGKDGRPVEWAKGM